MCGLAGFFSDCSQGTEALQLLAMLDKIKHRGPDDLGVWDNGKLYLGHTRLSIHDLSQAGHQPMKSECQKHLLVFNGEIYNYHQLKSELKYLNLKFQGDSDTEVLLACLKNWGVEKTLTKIDGMFAFSYWNAETNDLFLARDRMGEKPLYWFHNNNQLAFASELNSLVVGINQPLEISTLSVDLFLKFSYIPAPHSIYDHIYKLLPGHFGKFNLNDLSQSISIVQYFSPNVVDRDLRCEKTATNTLEDLLLNSIDERLAADVSVGAFLSGGIDSSLVCALAKNGLDKDIDTFTIGFNETEFDESVFAKDVAKHLNCRNHVEIIEQQDMLDVIPLMASVYSEPFADASQLPTYLLCQKTKSSVTVALSGDGGDELFGGYTRYHKTINRWQQIKKLPKTVKNSALYTSQWWDSALGEMDFFIKRKEQIRRVIRYGSAKNLRQFYQDSLSYDWQKELSLTDLPSHNLAINDDLTYLMHFDALQYLPDDILTKIDRASMAHSLEVRVPLLANSILDFSAQLHSSLLVKEGTTKWPLRKVLYKYVPEKLVERPKKGFAVPLKSWLREDLRPWAESLLSNHLLKEAIPHVNHKKYYLYWQQHQQGKYDWSGQLWNYLQLLSWLHSVHK